MSDGSEVLKHRPVDTPLRRTVAIEIEEELVFQALPGVVEEAIHDLLLTANPQAKTFSLIASWDNRYLGTNEKAFKVVASVVATEKKPGTQHTRAELEALMREAHSTRSYEDLAFYEKELAQLDKEGT